VNLHTLDLSDSDIGNSGLRFLIGKSGFYGLHKICSLQCSYWPQFQLTAFTRHISLVKICLQTCVDHVCRQIFVEWPYIVPFWKVSFAHDEDFICSQMGSYIHLLMLLAWFWTSSGLKLESLNLSFTTGVMDSGLRMLATITSLSSLNLDSQQITDSGLAALTSMLYAQSLSVDARQFVLGPPTYNGNQLG